MAERVHPTESDAASVDSGDAIPPAPPSKSPHSGTFVIQLPKDQIYRVPPPESAIRFDLYTRRNNHPCSCRRFLCSILLIAAVLLLLFAIVSGIFFLIIQPLYPRYSVLSISAKGIQPTSLLPNASISPHFNLTVRAENPNRRIGIYYERNGSVSVYFWNVTLCDGALPAFYQPPSNVTVMAAKIRGSGARLLSGAVKELKDSVKMGKVKLTVDLRVLIKLKVFSMKSWRIRAKVSCEILVKKITGEMNLMDQKCDHSLNLWWRQNQSVRQSIDQFKIQVR